MNVVIRFYCVIRKFSCPPKLLAPTLGPTQPLFQWVPETFYLAVYWPGISPLNGIGHVSRMDGKRKVAFSIATRSLQPINASRSVFFLFLQFFTAATCTCIYIHIIQFHLYHSVNIYSNWLQEKFCNLSLHTLYILSVQ